MSTPEQKPDQQPKVEYPWLRFAAAFTAAVMLAIWELPVTLR